MESSHEAHEAHAANRDGSMLGPTVLAFALLATGMVVPNTFGTLAVFLQSEFRFDDSQLGQLLALFWLATSVFAVTSGGLADRTGWRRSALAGCALIVLTWTTMATSHSMAMLAVAMVVGAIGYGCCSPTSNLIVVRLVRPSRQAFSFGIKQTAPTVMTMLGGLAVPAVAAAFGWRWALLTGVPAVVTTLGFVVFWRSRHDDGRRRGSSVRRGLLSNGGRRELVLMTVANGIGTFGMAGALGFGVRSLVAAGVGISAAGTTLAVASGAALAVRVFGGWWLDRLEPRNIRALVILIATGGAGALLMATTMPAVMIVGLVLSVCGSWSWPPLLLMRVIQRFSHAPGVASGTLQVGASLGAASGPLVFGLVAETVSFGAAWLMLAASCVVAVALVERAR